MSRIRLAALSAVLFVIAAPLAGADDVSGDRYQAALSNPDRFPGDRDRDTQRQPAKTLAFLGVEPGMRVLDLYSGGGYYAELLSFLVGPSGQVTAHNNTPYLGFAKDEIEARYADGRLGNVETIVAENNELDVESGRFDAVTMMLTYHDIYYVDPDNGWPRIDGPALLAELHDALKPGGSVLIVDHAAAPGASAETGNTTHRIDPDIVIREMDAAGFELAGRADFLRNEADDHSINVFDPAVRGKTDRFVLKFARP